MRCWHLSLYPHMVRFPPQHCGGSDKPLCPGQGGRGRPARSSPLQTQTAWSWCNETGSHCWRRELVWTTKHQFQWIQRDCQVLSGQKKVSLSQTHRSFLYFPEVSIRFTELFHFPSTGGCSLWSRSTYHWLQRRLCSWWAGYLWLHLRTFLSFQMWQEYLQNSWSRVCCTDWENVVKDQI